MHFLGKAFVFLFLHTDLIKSMFLVFGSDFFKHRLLKSIMIYCWEPSMRNKQGKRERVISILLCVLNMRFFVEIRNKQKQSQPGVQKKTNAGSGSFTITQQKLKHIFNQSMSKCRFTPVRRKQELTTLELALSRIWHLTVFQGWHKYAKQIGTV